VSVGVEGKAGMGEDAVRRVQGVWSAIRPRGEVESTAEATGSPAATLDGDDRLPGEELSMLWHREREKIRQRECHWTQKRGRGGCQYKVLGKVAKAVIGLWPRYCQLSRG
jgi:hypothetical protein